MKRMVVLLVVLAMSACGGKANDDKAAAGASGSGPQAVNRDTLTERQRDSILAGSRIPGARGVGKAMRVADSTSAGIEQTNAVARDTTPE
jgi:hypothetical protein